MDGVINYFKTKINEAKQVMSRKKNLLELIDSHSTELIWINFKYTDNWFYNSRDLKVSLQHYLPTNEYYIKIHYWFFSKFAIFNKEEIYRFLTFLQDNENYRGEDWFPDLPQKPYNYFFRYSSFNNKYLNEYASFSHFLNNLKKLRNNNKYFSLTYDSEELPFELDESGIKKLCAFLQNSLMVMSEVHTS